MMKTIFKIGICCTTWLIFTSCDRIQPKSKLKPEKGMQTPLVFQNATASLTMQISGGAITDFHLQNQSINPLSWMIPTEWIPENNTKGAKFAGQFLCMGRWGAPSDGEIKMGIPHNGEQTVYDWKVLETNLVAGKLQSAKLQYDLMLDGMRVTRTARLHPTASALTVQEEVLNLNTIGRLHNMVQHCTLGSPFLDTSTQINSNAEWGFNQQDSLANLDHVAFKFPMARNANDTFDVRKSSYLNGYCVSYLVKSIDSLGWVSAYTPNTETLLLYIWKRSEYPWLNIWHHIENGKALAKGIEFGTCGMGQPYQRLLYKNAIFRGKQSFEYIDAGETVKKQYAMLLLKVPKDFGSIQDVMISQNRVEIKGSGVSAPVVTSNYLPLK